MKTIGEMYQESMVALRGLAAADQNMSEARFQLENVEYMPTTADFEMLRRRYAEAQENYAAAIQWAIKIGNELREVKK